MSLGPAADLTRSPSELPKFRLRPVEIAEFTIDKRSLLSAVYAMAQEREIDNPRSCLGRLLEAAAGWDVPRHLRPAFTIIGDRLGGEGEVAAVTHGVRELVQNLLTYEILGITGDEKRRLAAGSDPELTSRVEQIFSALSDKAAIKVSLFWAERHLLLRVRGDAIKPLAELGEAPKINKEIAFSDEFGGRGKIFIHEVFPRVMQSNGSRIYVGEFPDSLPRE